MSLLIATWPKFDISLRGNVLKWLGVWILEPDHWVLTSALSLLRGMILRKLLNFTVLNMSGLYNGLIAIPILEGYVKIKWIYVKHLVYSNHYISIDYYSLFYGKAVFEIQCLYESVRISQWAYVAFLKIPLLILVLFQHNATCT